MTAAQIEEILKREEDPEKFGDLAVAAGYDTITAAQFGRNGVQYKSDFSQGMIDEKIVDYCALEALLLNMRIMQL